MGAQPPSDGFLFTWLRFFATIHERKRSTAYIHRIVTLQTHHRPRPRYFAHAQHGTAIVASTAMATSAGCRRAREQMRPSGLSHGGLVASDARARTHKVQTVAGLLRSAARHFDYNRSRLVPPSNYKTPPDCTRQFAASRARQRAPKILLSLCSRRLCAAAGG